jgi:plasmid maintenance system killer protein
MIQSFGDRDTEALFNREQIKKLHPNLFQRARSKLLIIDVLTIIRRML